MKTIVIILIILSATGTRAQLAGGLWANVDADGLVTTEVEVYHMAYDPAPGDWTDIVITRKLLGTCQEPVVVSATPRDTPAPGSDITFEWQEYIPAPNHHYRYEVMARDTQGGLHSTYRPEGASHDYVAWGEAVAVRATIYFGGGDCTLLPCPEGCWEGLCWSITPAALGITELQALIWHGTGQVLDIYGTIYPNSMPTDCTFTFTHVEEHEGDCTPIPNRTSSWGDLKSSYR